MKDKHLSPGNWWIVVVLVALALPVNVVVGFVVAVAGATVGADTEAITWSLWGLIGCLLLVSPIAIYHDRQYVSTASEWTPTRWYYFTFLGYVGMTLATVYLVRRRVALADA